jgi:hypothetical protein
MSCDDMKADDNVRMPNSRRKMMMTAVKMFSMP